jgi:hypothetical protein
MQTRLAVQPISLHAPDAPDRGHGSPGVRPLGWTESHLQIGFHYVKVGVMLIDLQTITVTQ